MNDQERRELMIKAAVKFEGKWPEGATLLYRLGEKITAAKDNGDLNPVEVPTPSNIHTSLMVGVDAWQPLCNQQEFEAFMQDLADKAPEGAEHYSPKEGKFAECWFKFDEEWMFSIIGGEKWHRLTPKSIIEKRTLIPLPKREPSPWVPEVGQECEAFLAIDHNPRLDDWVWCICAGRLSNGACLLEYNDGSFDCVWNKTKFRPLRTEAEIEREELAGDIIRIARAITSDRFMPKEAEQEFVKLAECIYGIGYRKVNE